MNVTQGVLAVALGASAIGLAAPMQGFAEEAKDAPQEVRTFYLTNRTQHDDLNDLQTSLRNMLPKARLYVVPSVQAITIRSTPEDIAIAEKIIADLDRPEKIYRLTYTVTESDAGKRLGVQHFAIVVSADGKTELKQGSKVPIVTGSYETGNAASMNNTQVQYLDVGLDIEARLYGDASGVKLYSKIIQSSLADEKSTIAAQDPVIRQTALEGSSNLTPGKPLIIGSLDVPGSTRHQDVEVVAELVK